MVWGAAYVEDLGDMIKGEEPDVVAESNVFH